VTTDFIQAVLMFFALGVVFIGSIVSAGGVDATVQCLQNIPGFLSGTTTADPILDASGSQIVQDGIAQFGDAKDYGIITIISMLAWGLGYFGMPHVLIRFMGIRSADEIKKSRVIAVSWCVLSLFCAISIGILGRALNPLMFATQSAAENVFIILSQSMLPPLLCGIVVSGSLLLR
jgi:sodium/proline symporter